MCHTSGKKRHTEPPHPDGVEWVVCVNVKGAAIVAAYANTNSAAACAQKAWPGNEPNGAKV